MERHPIAANSPDGVPIYAVSEIRSGPWLHDGVKTSGRRHLGFLAFAGAIQRTAQKSHAWGNGYLSRRCGCVVPTRKRNSPDYDGDGPHQAARDDQRRRRADQPRGALHDRLDESVELAARPAWQEAVHRRRACARFPGIRRRRGRTQYWAPRKMRLAENANRRGESIIPASPSTLPQGALADAILGYRL